MSGETSDYLARNVAAWEASHEREAGLARRQWAADEPNWGIFSIPERVARLLPEDLERMQTVELGCGTGYVSSWLARRGARPVAVDPTPGQLAIASACQQEFGVTFPLVRAAGEKVPLRSGAFDLVISEYGAAIWADPYRWIPEAARLLKPGGELVFLGNSTLIMLCLPEEDETPAEERLVRAQFGMHRFDWEDTQTVDFHLGHGDWIRLLRANGFDVEELQELRPPEGARTNEYQLATLEWARKWPCEDVWHARKRAVGPPAG